MSNVESRRPGMGTVRRNPRGPGMWQGVDFVEQEERVSEGPCTAARLWKFLGKDPMVCGVAWERGAPWDDV